MLVYSKMSEDNRIHDRYPFMATINLRCNLQHDENGTINAFVANISQKGIGLYSLNSICPGSPITIELMYTDVTGNPNTNLLDGEIAWEKRQNNHFFAGVSLYDELFLVQI